MPDALSSKLLDVTGGTSQDGSFIAGSASGSPNALRKLVLDGDAEFFVGKDLTPYVRIPTGAVVPIRSAEFRYWVRRLARTELKNALVRGGDLKDLVELCMAEAVDAGDTRGVFVRVARSEGRVYIDLGDDTYDVVEVAPTGWRIVAAREAPVLFRRERTCRPLPRPVPGGRLADLRPFIYLSRDDQAWSLAAAFLVSALALAPQGPYPFLFLGGADGTARTTVARRISSLLDPRMGGVGNLPTELHSLSLRAHNAHLLVFNFVSFVPPVISDGLCRLATHGAFATRRLYEDSEEVVREDTRPFILAGTPGIVIAQELADLAVPVDLGLGGSAEHTETSPSDEEFDLALPMLLGALLDAVALVLARAQGLQARGVSMGRLPGFALVARAAEPAFGVPAGTVDAALRHLRREGGEAILALDPFLAAVRDFALRRKTWTGSATTLLSELKAPKDVPRAQWPQTPAAAGKRLGQGCAALADVGVVASTGRTADARAWTIQAMRPEVTATADVSGLTSAEIARVLASSDRSDGADMSAPQLRSSIKGSTAAAADREVPKC